MSDKKILLETKSLEKYFHTPSGELHAIDDVNMQIMRGQTLGVVGESECGKSTLGRTILRLSEPSSGQIFFDGKDILKCGRKDMQNLRADVQIIFQDLYASLNPHMTVSKAIKQPMMVGKICRKKSEVEKRVAELIDTVGLTSRLYSAYPHELDGGRRQRVGIAGALSLNPKFVVCNELVSALNASIQVQILNLLIDSQEQRGLACMFIAHNLPVVKHISNEIMVMYLGQYIEETSSRELLKNPLHPYTQMLLDSIPIPGFQGRNRKRQSIKGGAVSPIGPAPSYRFAPGCPRATGKCMGHDIPLRNISENHQVTYVLFN